MSITEPLTTSDRSNHHSEKPEYRSLLVVIPSRNRSDLARRAIASTLDAPASDQVNILVSDNSTDVAEMAALCAFCHDLNDDRVHYIRPPEPMKMAMHWNWLFQTALDKFDFTHLTLLADRRIYRSGALHELCDLARRHPDSAITTHSDTCYDDLQPIKLASKSWSGRLLKVRSEDMLRGNALGILEVMVLVPVPFTSIIPRRLFQQVHQRFGDYCLSLAPDYCFGYRVLDVDESVLLYDKSMSLMLGTARSNGMSMMRGTATKDKADFIATNGGEEFRYSLTPIPEMITGINGIFHEYNFIRNQAQSGRFPELDLPGYLANLQSEVTTFFENAELKDHYLGLLAARRPQEISEATTHTNQVPPLSPAIEPQWKQFPRRVARKLLRAPRRLLHNRPMSKVWFGLNRVTGAPLPTWIEIFGFSSVEDSITFFNSKKTKLSNQLEQVLKVQEVTN